jgi:hypothetical protein
MDFVENLRERLQNEANGAEDMVQKLEENARNPNLGAQQGLMEQSVISQYEATARQLLEIVSEDPDGLAALEHVGTLRQRVSGALEA